MRRHVLYTDIFTKVRFFGIVFAVYFQWHNTLTGGPWANYIRCPMLHFKFTEKSGKHTLKLPIKHKTMMKCKVKSNLIKIACLVNYSNT